MLVLVEGLVQLLVRVIPVIVGFVEEQLGVERDDATLLDGGELLPSRVSRGLVLKCLLRCFVGVACSASQVPPGVFAYVPQDNFLFAGSIRENVAFAAPDVTDDQVKRACEVACAWDFVEELPLGLDTMIGEHGQGLSQGQLQRLAIARAVCSSAPIMVLDEVTSALDDATEAAVLANIASLPGKTIFVAAHRAKAREFATMRLHVEDGVLAEAR